MVENINISNGLSGGGNGSKSFSKQSTINKKAIELAQLISKKLVGDVEAHKIMNNGWGPYGRRE